MSTKSNKIEHEQHLDECVEYILTNLAGWTTFTSWAREKYHINNRQANDLWKASWIVISENVAQERASRKDYYMNEIERIKIQAEADEKWGDALRAVQTQIELDGLDIQQIEAKINGTINLKWADETNDA